MVGDANPKELASKQDFSSKQTVELRSPDGSADIYLLLAGILVAARHGFTMPDALGFAEKKYVAKNTISQLNFPTI